MFSPNCLFVQFLWILIFCFSLLWHFNKNACNSSFFCKDYKVWFCRIGVFCHFNPNPLNRLPLPGVLLIEWIGVLAFTFVYAKFFVVNKSEFVAIKKFYWCTYIQCSCCYADNEIPCFTNFFWKLSNESHTIWLNFWLEWKSSKALANSKTDQFQPW